MKWCSKLHFDPLMVPVREVSGRLPGCKTRSTFQLPHDYHSSLSCRCNHRAHEVRRSSPARSDPHLHLNETMLETRFSMKGE